MAFDKYKNLKGEYLDENGSTTSENEAKENNVYDSMMVNRTVFKNEKTMNNSARFNYNTEMAKKKIEASNVDPKDNRLYHRMRNFYANRRQNDNGDMIIPDETGAFTIDIGNPNEIFDIKEEEMRTILNSSNIYSPEQIAEMRFSRFARYGMLDIANENSGTREYIFFTKPDLHIFNPESGMEINHQLKDVNFFKNAIKQYPMSLLSLQQSINPKRELYPTGYNPRSLFIPLLSNHVTSSFDLPGITATETENNTTLFQVKTTYRDSSEQSDFGFEFSLEFWDTRYLDVYMFFKGYDEYCREEFYRNVTPPKLSYRDDKVNCKQFSIFKIIVDETNTIMFYAKATGVYPMGVPRDAMSNFENTIKITVPFKAQFVRDMDPIILTELNHLTLRSSGKQASELSFLNTYNTDIHAADTTWGMYPFVIKGSKRSGVTDEKQDNLYTLAWVAP